MGWTAIVLNDSSGSGDGAKSAQQLSEIFAEAGREARITVARGGDQLRTAMKEAVKGRCETLVAGGGDGTINTAASELVDSDIPLGVIPLGTLNHFAKDLGIPIDLAGAAKVVLEGARCQVDVGEVNGRVFLNNSSLGAYPAIVRLRDRYQASGWGKWLAALWAGLVVLRRNPFMGVRIEAEGETILRRTPLVFVGNNEYQMTGLQAGSRKSLTTGRLAVYVLHAERRSGLLRLAAQILLKGAEVKELDLLSVETATVETRRPLVQVALDGEVVSSKSPMSYRIKPGALAVFVPQGTPACYPEGSMTSY
ncbi:MAG TPA: diacylglycerol kinase family protein [Gemmatimonadales bacterium]|nr:diacylglycerol kinase family protein [Gemmatimonadales bacterium]